MQIKLTHGRKHGLEIWTVVVNGVRKHTYFSERHARTRFLQLKASAEGK